MYHTIRESGYQIKMLVGSQKLNLKNDNVDVFVIFDSGETFVATLFTLENIHSLMEKFKKSGECLNGLYFWASGMILMRDLTDESIRKVIKEMIVTGEFKKTFMGPLIDQS